jgi:hypothetical protein
MKELSLNGLTPTPDSYQPNFNPKDLPWVGCEQGIQIFEAAYVFKRLSPILSPTGKEEMIPAEVVVCRQCGKVPSFITDKIADFPEELKSTCGSGK